LFWHNILSIPKLLTISVHARLKRIATLAFQRDTQAAVRIDEVLAAIPENVRPMLSGLWPRLVDLRQGIFSSLEIAKSAG
jgi:hypothetical protein